MFVSAGMLLAGCAEIETPKEGGSVIAIMEGDQTRTSVTDEGVFSWSAGDQVWLQTTNGSVVGTLSSGAGTSRASFSTSVFIGELTGKAVYPYNDSHSISGDELSFVLPASYDLGSNLANTNAAMYGVDVDGTIRFNHLGGVMRFVFRNAPVGTDKFQITLDKKINGIFTAGLLEALPVIETSAASSESEKTVTLTFDALESVSDISLYVPLPVGTYTTLGLELWAGDKSLWSYSNTVTNKIGRKTLKLMPAISLSGEIGGEIEGGDTPKEGDYVDEYGINHGQGVNIDGVVWAPVNCGYHKENFKYGKLYQWGRKYGQGYDGYIYDVNYVSSRFSDASSPSLMSGPVSVLTGQSETNSNVFYSISSAPYDWVTPQNDELWNSGSDENPVKTEYDPCPAGWRVPTYTELSELSKNYSSRTLEGAQTGYWFSGSIPYSESVSRVFLPDAAFLNYSNGYAYYRGDYGCYWSSTPKETSSYTLFFHSLDLYMDRIYRAHGNSVRCVREGTAPEIPSAPAPVNLSVDGTANSYIVSETGSYSFSPVKGNSTDSVGAIASVETLWESFGTHVTPNVGDLLKNVKYTDGLITFDTPSNFKEGNAVIAAKDASGTILWSWHIWLTDQPEEQVYYNNAGTMMDRNLGATSATPGDVGALGLLYQWGRKDPFLGSSSISSSIEAKSTISWPSTVPSTSSTGTTTYAVQHPTTFITYNNYNADWDFSYSGAVEYSRWATPQVSYYSKKAIYDPCPAGWRVPFGGEDSIWLEALELDSYHYSITHTRDKENQGMDFSSTFGSASSIWYPATGYRYGGDGVLKNVGYGYYWSAYICQAYEDSDFGASFRMGGNEVTLYYDQQYPADGLAVRCVQE